MDTVPELAQRKAQNLFDTLTKTNAEKKLVRQTPSLSAVKSWIAAAQDMPRVLQYYRIAAFSPKAPTAISDDGPAPDPSCVITNSDQAFVFAPPPKSMARIRGLLLRPLPAASSAP